MANYDMFLGHELEIADRIQKLRLCILVHSCIYYEMDSNLVSDRQWDAWAKELVKLQSEYPEISKQVIRYDEFKDWDGSTGAFLPLKDEWVQKRASILCGKQMTIPSKCSGKKEVVNMNKTMNKIHIKTSTPKRSLF